jgi:hypothetical protein
MRVDALPLFKFLLDWVYLGLKGDVPLHRGELQFGQLNIPKLLEIRKKFPRSVLDTILPTLLENCIPSESVLQKA